MINDIRLYLCNMQVDLKQNPSIYYNFALTDTTNPTAVKNSFSKTLEIEGTDNNNKIFGQIWDLERYQTTGVFNPLKKADFELYYNGMLYESGYFKLTEIRKSGELITYSITLYGGLGEYFYNLAYGENGEKREFADLQIPYDNDFEIPEIKFDLNKDVINDAWDTLENHSTGIYNIVNFAPAYNGVPEGFDADRILVNEQGLDNSVYTHHSPYKRYALATAPRALTEWETFDLRSYLQKPVARVKSLIAACCLPENNGGFDIQLDNRFFNVRNPYYQDAWITLPSLNKAKSNERTTEKVITDGTITRESSLPANKEWEITTSEPFAEYNNLNIRIIPKYNPTSYSGTQLFTCYRFTANNSFTLQSRFAKYYARQSAFLIQLRVYDASQKLVGASDYYQLITRMNNQVDFSNYAEKGYKVNTIYGWFDKIDGEFVWVNENNEPVGLEFSLNTDNNFNRIVLHVETPYEETLKYTMNGGNITDTRGNGGAARMFSQPTDYYNGNKGMDEVMAWRAVNGNYAEELDNFSLLATDYEDLHPVIKVEKKDLFTLGFTPCDFLLSYCKMFGLYFIKDTADKKIRITDRTGFFNRNEIENINDRIDRANGIKIAPSTADKKYYDMLTEQTPSETAAEYEGRYGQEYGLQRINTGYNFDNEASRIYEGVFKGAIDCLESSPYFYKPYDDKYPVYIWNGYKYTSFEETEDGIQGTEYSIEPLVRENSPLNPDLRGYDTFAKPQYHSADNKAENGDFTLLFLMDSPISAETSYWLTDDIQEMVELNNKKPCWISTTQATDMEGNTIAIERTTLPSFRRMRVYDETGIITHSWDFGKPLETYVPNTYVSNGMSIYEKCWKNYIADIYDENARKVTCNVLFDKQLSIESMRKFYWFDNSIWILTKVTDWNPTNSTSTLCEFVKIKDVDDFYVEMITKNPALYFTFPELPIESEEEEFNERTYKPFSSGKTILEASIECQDGGYWAFGDGAGASFTITYEDGYEEYMDYADVTSPDYGYGNATRIFTIPANERAYARQFHLNVIIYAASGDETSVAILQQEAKREIQHSRIYYVSTDSQIIQPNTGVTWEENIISNTYTDRGCIEFDGVITKIPENAFNGITRLGEITIPDTITEIGGTSSRNGAFQSCTNLIVCNLPSGLQNIGYGAFRNSSLQSAIIPDSVVYIAPYAFYGCALEELKLPSGITAIETASFANANSACTYSAITIPENVDIIEGGAFRYNDYLQVVNMGSNVLEIGNNTFRDCPALNEINISATTAPSILTDTFQGVGEYGTLNYPAGSNYDSWLSRNPYYLGYYGWNTPAPFVKATPNTITNVGSAGQSINIEIDMYSIDSLVLPTDSWLTWNVSAITEMHNSVQLIVAANAGDARTAELQIEYEGEVMENIVVSQKSGQEGGTKIYYTTTDGLTISPDMSLSWGANLISNTYVGGVGCMEFDTTLMSIPHRAFKNNRNLQTIIIPDEIVNLGDVERTSSASSDSIFSGCTNLESVVLSNGLVNMWNNYTFMSTAISSITIPDSVVYLGASVFRAMPSLERVIIGSGVQTMYTGNYSANFYGSTNLTYVEFHSAACPDFKGTTVFGNINTAGELHIPVGSRNSYESLIAILPSLWVVYEDL